MNLKVQSPAVQTSRTAQAEQAKTVEAPKTTQTGASQQATQSPALGMPPVPSAAQQLAGQSVLPASIAAQLAKIPQVAGQSDVHYSVQLDPNKKYAKFGIFLEIESKAQPVDDSAEAIKAIKDAITAAVEKDGIAGFLPAGYKGPFSGLQLKWDRVDSKAGSKFRDHYLDDDKGSLAAVGASCRERAISTGTDDKGNPVFGDPKFETKLPGGRVMDSSCLARVESSILLDSGAGRTRQVVIENAKKGELDNPITILLREVPGLDLATLRPRVEIADSRNQVLMFDQDNPNGKFIMTFDTAKSTRLDNGKVGYYYEFEIERMDGSKEPGKVAELVSLTNAVNKRFDLVPSQGNKYTRGLTVTE